jgi:ABC-type branched-subunit amino acid transport system substrate-binding protein
MVRVRYIAVVGAIGLMAAACSSSGGTATGTSGRSGSPSGGSGSPIEVIQDQAFPGTDISGQQGAAAAVQYINTHGGLGGRQIKIDYCDGSTAQRAQACGRQAEGDPNIVAAIANFDVFGGFNPVAPDVPDLSCALLTAADFKAPNCFTTSTGSLVPASAAFGSYALGLKNMVLPYLNVPAAQGETDEINTAVLTSRGQKLRAGVPISGSQTDLSPIIASLPSDTDGLLTAVVTAQAAQLIIDSRQAGKTFPVITTASDFSANTMKTLVGSSATNVYVVSQYKFSGPWYDAYETQMDAIGQKGTANNNNISLSAWLGVQMLKHAVMQVGPKNVTRESILKAMKATSNFDTGGLTPPLDWMKPSTVLGGSEPNLINPDVVAYKYDPASGGFVLYTAYHSGNFFNYFTGAS